MEPLKHYGFLFDSSSPRSSRSTAKGEERVEVKIDSKPSAKWQKERLTIPSEVKSAHLD